MALYARTPEELYDKELGALEQIDNDTFLQPSPISTSPIMVALSAKNVSFPILGVKPLTDFIKAIII